VLTQQPKDKFKASKSTRKKQNKQVHKKQNTKQGNLHHLENSNNNNSISAITPTSMRREKYICT
jgi:hypothetical protein